VGKGRWCPRGRKFLMVQASNTIYNVLDFA